ncbi:hypothetical protein NDN08_001277 [Rhodosorus marinus]|uniref:2-C-methyl-D-erythritol 4-phosphate cytidylyltransferase, chloroplastic n=1 Tax=Rhodosorus marinus TaxID=101924 RepID=A0AAV8UQF7_9RHOD|nr:hypothetical protein NDN08_001277 [Rhodosorus marinus]
MSSSDVVETGTVSRQVCAIVLAGGVGKRMKADVPKQFLVLDGQTILHRSLELFLSLPEVTEVVLVVDESYHEDYADLSSGDRQLHFASPGNERQDSVYNGLQKATVNDAGLICVHDAARPLVTPDEIRKVLNDAEAHGAAVLGVPCKATVKESEDGSFVLRTIQRSRLWEVQTPQVVEKKVLTEGFDLVREQDLEVTDDVSIVEQLGRPVKLTMGEYTNIKITTPEDLPIAESILNARKSLS